jgi:hypothetical protein
MLGPQGFREDAQGTSIEPLGLRETSHVLVQHRPVVANRRHFQIVRPEGFLRERQGTPVERLGAGIAPPGPVETGQVTERFDADALDVGQAVGLLGNADRPLEMPFRFGVFVETQLDQAEGIENVGDIGMIHSVDHLQKPERPLAQRFRHPWLALFQVSRRPVMQTAC